MEELPYRINRVPRVTSELLLFIGGGFLLYGGLRAPGAEEFKFLQEAANGLELFQGTAREAADYAHNIMVQIKQNGLWGHLGGLEGDLLSFEQGQLLQTGAFTDSDLAKQTSVDINDAVDNGVSWKRTMIWGGRGMIGLSAVVAVGHRVVDHYIRKRDYLRRIVASNVPTRREF